MAPSNNKGLANLMLMNVLMEVNEFCHKVVMVMAHNDGLLDVSDMTHARILNRIFKN
jgi:hypothetical protein